MGHARQPPANSSCCKSTTYQLFEKYLDTIWGSFFPSFSPRISPTLSASAGYANPIRPLTNSLIWRDSSDHRLALSLAWLLCSPAPMAQAARERRKCSYAHLRAATGTFSRVFALWPPLHRKQPGNLLEPCKFPSINNIGNEFLKR